MSAITHHMLRGARFTLTLAFTLAVALLGGCAPAASPNGGSSVPRELHVSAASSLTGVLEATASDFEAANHVQLVFNYAASGVLQMQIEGGARADVFLSASPLQVESLIAKGLIGPDDATTFARNGLVLFVPAGNPAAITGPDDLSAAKRLVTGNPSTAPHGTKTREWLQSLGQWEALQPHFVYAENSAQTLDYVVRGEVDAGIGFASEVQGENEVEVVYAVPEAAAKPAHYVAAPVKGAPDARLPAAYVAYLSSPAVQAAFIEAGFLPASDE